MADHPVLDKKILTNDAWQKNKGAYAKAVGKTGLGEALDALNSAYKAVDWEFIGIMPILKKKEYMAEGKAKVLAHQRFAKKNCTQAARFETALNKVITVAGTTKTKFTSSKLPNVKTGAKAVDAVLKSARDLKSDFDKHPYKLTYNQWDDFVKRFGDDLK